MSEELLDAIQKTVDYLDEQMDEQPSRELADTSNYLQAILNKEKKEN